MRNPISSAPDDVLWEEKSTTAWLRLQLVVKKLPHDKQGHAGGILGGHTRLLSRIKYIYNDKANGNIPLEERIQLIEKIFNNLSVLDGIAVEQSKPSIYKKKEAMSIDTLENFKRFVENLGHED